jgi:hypothetical protein
MIPEVFIENWRKTVPWQMTEQIEQDLMISRALIDLYNDILSISQGKPKFPTSRGKSAGSRDPMPERDPWIV